MNRENTKRRDHHRRIARKELDTRKALKVQRKVQQHYKAQRRAGGYRTPAPLGTFPPTEPKKPSWFREDNMLWIVLRFYLVSSAAAAAWLFVVWWLVERR